MIYQNASPYEAYWRGPFRGWGVYYTLVRRAHGGRLVAVFRGKYGNLRAKKRAWLRSMQFYATHRPEPVRMPPPPQVGSCAVIPR